MGSIRVKQWTSYGVQRSTCTNIVFVLDKNHLQTDFSFLYVRLLHVNIVFNFYCLFIVELLLGLSSLSIWSHLRHPCALIVPIRLPLLLWWKTPVMNTGIIYYHWIYLQINVLLYTASERSLLQTELYFHPPRSIWLKALWRCICCTRFRSWSVAVSIWLPIEKLNICFSKEELWYFFWLIKK